MSGFIVPILLLIDGLVSILTATFAHELGFDPDSTWGRTRFILAISGGIAMLIALLMIFFRERIRVHFKSAINSETSTTIFLISHLWMAIFLIYIWFITYGTFLRWDHTSNYYSQLADAFNKKQTHLDIRPSEAILATQDPYEFTNRPRQEEIWDMSLYKDKIYLYWGPIPALVIAPIQLFFNVKIPEIFLDFFFYAGLTVINSMMILKLRENFFRSISIWNAMICIALISLISPILWALTPTTIYGTAIGAGHFFLMGGIYFCLSAFEQKMSPDRRKLFLAGLFWACSVACRAMNVLPIIFLAVLMVFWIAKTSSGRFNWKKYLQTVTPLFIPLITGAAALAWYNWERFDSPLEFGMRYQITFFNLNRDAGLIFDWDYLLLNLYTYIFQPFTITSRFPFTIPIYTPTVLDKYGILPPKMFFAGKMTGLLFGAPFLLFSLVHLFAKKQAVPINTTTNAGLTYDLVIYILTGSFLISFLSVMFFFFGQMRYLVDGISQITLLAILGYWKLLSTAQKTNSVSLKISVTLAHCLMAFTICASLLLGVTSETSRLEKFNPVLFEKIASSITLQK